jgi:hypothetical protein
VGVRQGAIERRGADAGPGERAGRDPCRGVRGLFPSGEGESRRPWRCYGVPLASGPWTSGRPERPRCCACCGRHCRCGCRDPRPRSDPVGDRRGLHDHDRCRGELRSCRRGACPPVR